MKKVDNECHFLVIHEPTGDRPVYLIAPTYALGRDASCSIPLNSRSVSRQHALLLRMPNPETGKYQFRLLDGNASGKPSLNGIAVNGQRCSVHDLVDGDRIVFGGDVEVTYQIRFATDEQLNAAQSELYYFSPEERQDDEELFTILTKGPSVSKELIPFR